MTSGSIRVEPTSNLGNPRQLPTRGEKSRPTPIKDWRGAVITSVQAFISPCVNGDADKPHP